ncbi:PKD domain-containing protein [Argonema galeatum]|uniref:PKD domain-containing protein n=1 Tax=Argonema galeatum TaxID=2942762 RepID=UPI00201280C9|nr:PKD domain-containing protein [Argonema galeatum]MCL1466176.1 PEP-CTERM sorting domain-containing protein [Argonema galeatum A003/A1]
MATVKKFSITTAFAASIALASVSTAQAATLGGQLFSTGGDVSVRILGGDAKATSYLSLYSPWYQGIGSNREPGKVVNVGSFGAGQELIFGINVNGGNTYLMGPSSRNPDNTPHAVVDFLAPGVAKVGFDDGWGGGDWDFNDVMFQFSGAIAPTQPAVPPTLTGVFLNGNNSDLTIYEGQSVSAALQATDPNPQPITFLVGGNPVGTDSRTSGTREVGANLGFFADEGNFTYGVQAQDSSGLYSNTITRTLNVLNVDPILTSLTQDIAEIRTETLFDFAATATDPGINDVLTYDWDFDSNGLFDDFTGLSGKWSFADPGLHNVNLRVSDGDGGFAYGSFKVKAVPEPSSVLGLLAFGAFGVSSLLKRKQQQKVLNSVATD